MCEFLHSLPFDHCIASFCFSLFNPNSRLTSSTLAWKIPWTDEPGGLPSLGSHRVGHYWSDFAAAAAHLTSCLQSVTAKHLVCFQILEELNSLLFFSWTWLKRLACMHEYISLALQVKAKSITWVLIYVKATEEFQYISSVLGKTNFLNVL